MAVWVGLFLRHSGVDIEASQALPYFLNTYFPPAISGGLWAGLAITVIGGAAGLSLGIATNLSMDIFAKLFHLKTTDKKSLWLSRSSVLLTVLTAAVLALAFKDNLILQLSYMAMGLRGAGMVVPLLAAILKPAWLSPRSAFASSALGLCGMLLAWLFLPDTEPLFVGLIASVSTAAIANTLGKTR